MKTTKAEPQLEQVEKRISELSDWFKVMLSPEQSDIKVTDKCLLTFV